MTIQNMRRRLRALPQNNGNEIAGLNVSAWLTQIVSSQSTRCRQGLYSNAGSILLSAQGRSIQELLNAYSFTYDCANRPNLLVSQHILRLKQAASSCYHSTRIVAQYRSDSNVGSTLEVLSRAIVRFDRALAAPTAKLASTTS
jgi:hypothetical protein